MAKIYPNINIPVRNHFFKKKFYRFIEFIFKFLFIHCVLLFLYTNRQEVYYVQKRFIVSPLRNILYFYNIDTTFNIHFLSDLTENFKYITHPYVTKIKINFCKTRMCQDTAHAFTPSHSQTHNI